MGDLISLRRCGTILRVTEHSHVLLLPGDYPCTLPMGHEPKDKHACVVKWGEIQFTK